MAIPAGTSRSEERKRHIREAALRCFVRHGFHQASMAGICAEAEMSPGNLYRYYDSKEAIIAAIVEEERERYAALVAASLEHDDIIDGLLAMADIGFRGTDAAIQPRLFIEMMAESLRNPRMAEIMTTVDKCMVDDIAAALRAGQKAGQVDATLDPEMITLMIGCTYDGMVYRLQMLPPEEHDAAIEGFRKMVRRILSPQPKNTLSKKSTHG